MSTATLLIVTARLRSIAHAGRYRDPVPSSPLAGGAGSRGALLHGFSCSGKGLPETPPARVIFPARRSISPLACAGARFDPLPRARVLLTACLFALAGSTGAVGIARAQEDISPRREARDADNAVVVLPPLHVETEAPRTIGGKAPQGPCVMVDIGGERAGHLDCATRALQDAARTAQSEARAGIDAPVVGAGSSDVQTGVAHEGATRLRMGNALGRSVHPERPASRSPRGPRP